VNSKDNVFQVYFTGYGTIKDKNHDDSLESIGTLLYAPPEFFQDGIITDHKYDIYCMGRVLMYVWGGYDSPERVNNTTGEQEALSPEYQNLFTHLEKIPVSKNKIKEIIKCMCQAVSKKRPDVDRVIESFDELSNQLQTACKRKVNFGF
jgi:serine/threonine protein kinase